MLLGGGFQARVKTTLPPFALSAVADWSTGLMRVPRLAA